jgi:hypothetical protein
MRYVLPWLTKSIARSPELLMLFAIAWGTLLAALASEIGLTHEVGAFLAGFSLASMSVRDAIASRLTSLRDFLLLFFFVHLGAQLDFQHIGHDLVGASLLSAFVLIGNPLIVMAIMGFMGYRKRTGFMAGLTVAQISEFSIIFVAMGIGLGHVGAGVLGLTTLVGMVTITLSTYMILYAQPLYERISHWLDVFEREVPHREDAEVCGPEEDKRPVIIFGLGRYGRRLAQHLLEAGRDVVGVDFDPEAIAGAARHGITAFYGDAEDTEYVHHLPLSRAPWVVSTVPEVEINDTLLRALSEAGYEGRVAVSAFQEGHAERLQTHGVQLVFHPYTDAAEMAARHLLKELAIADGPPVPANGG